MERRNPFKLPGFDTPRPETTLTKLMSERGEFIGGCITIDRACEDPDFVEAFTAAVPDPEEQLLYLDHTSRYENRQKDYNPEYVLFFRRTIPSKTPKHEERWSNEYVQVVRGLRQEIPEGPHRHHSIILCDSLRHITSNGENTEARGFTDGEIVVNFPEYDQSTCICKFKPSHEKEALKEYLKKSGALSEEETLAKVQEHKGYKSKKV